MECRELAVIVDVIRLEDMRDRPPAIRRSVDRG
jgi:hypothetical protein